MDVSGYSQLRLTYKTLLFNLGNVYGPFEISVNYSLDESENWHQLMTFDDPSADYGPQTDEYIIDLPSGSETMQIAFKWEGNTANIFDWSVDNVVVEATGDYYGVFFNVTDEDGPPLSGVSVSVNGQSAEEVVKGLYFISQMPPGTYDYIIEKEEYFTEGGTLEVLDGDVFSNVSLTGFRYDVLFLVEDEEGEPVTNATIMLGDQVNDPGQYLFSDIRNGYYEYTIDKEGFFTVVDTLEVFGGDVTETVSMKLERYTVTFLVSDQDGNEIDDATVVFAGIENDPGQYVFEDTFPGIYQYNVSKDGYDSSSGEISVEDADVVENVQLLNHVSVFIPYAPEMRIYPNPAKTVVYVDAEEVINKLRLVNLLGQVVQTSIVQKNHFEMNVSGLRPGMYFVQIYTGKGITTEKLQISR